MRKGEWTPRDEQILRDEFNRRTTREIAAMLGRTYQATAVKASKLGLKKDHYGLVWLNNNSSYCGTISPPCSTNHWRGG